MSNNRLPILVTYCVVLESVGNIVLFFLVFLDTEGE